MSNLNKKYAVLGGGIALSVVAVSVLFLSSEKASPVTTLPASAVVSGAETSEPSLPASVGTATDTPEDSSRPLPVFTADSLRPYNGENAGLPIYIALEGLVYDVTPGKAFYEPGAVYHYLAGTDGTLVLQFMGGDIIKRKYKVVGTFSEE